jgi:hypothetical protein
MRTASRFSSSLNPKFVRWMARLTLLTLVLQLASLGHWSFGPFHPGPEGLASHSSHCHGDTSACGGQPSFVGTYVERPLAMILPLATTVLPVGTQATPNDVVPLPPDKPPRLP